MHACKVVQQSRTFLRRIFEFLKRRPKQLQVIRLNTAFWSDLMWWHVFLKAWNGIGIVQSLVDINLYTDASGSGGCGAWFNQVWIHFTWPKGVSGDWPIAIKEIIPIVFSGLLWGRLWHGKLVLAHCDNLAVVQVINSGYCKDLRLMHASP